MNNLLKKINQNNLWDKNPVFCFTSDLDWASEPVLNKFFDLINSDELKLTTFVTNESKVIQEKFEKNEIIRGIHPNFEIWKPNSHGQTIEKVSENVMKYAPESISFRGHRLLDGTSVRHNLLDNHNIRISSNLGTIMGQGIRPVLQESGMIEVPIFFEDGTHLNSGLNLDIEEYELYFKSPGIKVISFHPMNFVFNSPSIKYMRSIKDNTGEEYKRIDNEFIDKHKNREKGIQDTIFQIIDFVKSNNYEIMSLNEIYKTITK
jgi:hypothetical protein